MRSSVFPDSDDESDEPEVEIKKEDQDDPAVKLRAMMAENDSESSEMDRLDQDMMSNLGSNMNQSILSSSNAMDTTRMSKSGPNMMDMSRISTGSEMNKIGGLAGGMMDETVIQ